ncbi:hypothetical protein DUZ99_02690 [Xylanibacillus composti]|uniref:Uncharacterized protein n=1 Tax=Xylanibacillus composti TaxID=1572762 RepID=A0A8J4H1N2_9BACL|nr:hypothetical protein [Xylanibacillus composti]MDT9723904.1 hypothetical protein [Xylanibacillus composti]GIQ67782.1 hypothetical protein XYCOK13_06060 [Xylanibacillus composti]
MASLAFVSCGEDDALWDEYFLLLMEQYPGLSLPYGFPVAFSFIGDPIVRGDALLVREADGRTAGAIGFIFPDDAPAAARVCQVEALYLREEVRHASTLYRLLQALSAYLAERAPLVETIQFWSPADREDLRRLFGKCSQLVRTSVKDYGRIDLFKTSAADFAQYTSRCRGVRHKFHGGSN